MPFSFLLNGCGNGHKIMTTPIVSILVPCYNGARYLPHLCESIQAQTFGDFEVLFGNDNSTDNTVEIIQPLLRDPRFKLFTWKPNRGLHHNIVFLLNSARGRYWCLPGQDDILEPRFLEKRAAMLAAHPEAVLIHGAARWIDGEGRPFTDDFTRRALPELDRRLPESLPADRMLRILLQHDILNAPSTLVRMDITRLILPFFSPYWVWAMDWTLWILLAATGFDFLWDPEPMFRYRMHGDSISGSPGRKKIRRVERKLAPLYALHSASTFSPLAKTVWLEQRTRLYRWWLVTAAALRCKGTLNSRDMLMAAEAFRGAPGSANLWRELAIHGLPALLQYRREKAANRGQLFQVSGLSLMDDPLFKSI
jgi:glycosyltransferase involved in cell wall biosynthesis